MIFCGFYLIEMCTLVPNGCIVCVHVYMCVILFTCIAIVTILWSWRCMYARMHCAFFEIVWLCYQWKNIFLYSLYHRLFQAPTAFQFLFCLRFSFAFHSIQSILLLLFLPQSLYLSLSLFSVCLIILLFPNEIIRHWDILFIFLLNVFEDAFLYLFINSTFQTVCQTFPSSTSSWQSQNHSSDGARCCTRIASAMRSISPIPSLSLFHSLPLSFFLHSIAIAKWNINSIFFFLLCFLWLLAFSDFCTQFLLNMRWRYVFV